MARGPKGFSEDEKKELRSRLCVKCEESWAMNGYKKSSVVELTKSIGISIGSFYLLFASKEELFFETLKSIQNRLKYNWEQIMGSKTGLEGVREGMLWLYKEYRSFPFLYDFNNPDYLALIKRIPEATIKEFEFDSVELLAKAEEILGLRLKIERSKAYAVLGTLLYTVSLKESVLEDDLNIYEFLLDCTLGNIFHADKQ